MIAVLDREPGFNVAGGLWLLGGLGPPIAAVVITGLTDGSSGVRQLLGRLVAWRVRLRWYGVALLMPGIVIGLGVAFDALVLDVQTPMPTARQLLLFVGVLAYTAIIGGGLEEIGWRGFALPRLQASFSALTASLVIGVVWMIWHAPLFLVSGAIQTELPLIPYVVQGIALAVLFTWLYNSTRGSILLVVLFHGAFNAWLSSVWLLRDGVNPTTLWLIAGMFGVLAIVVVLVNGGENLSRRHRQTR